jgi:DNA-binding transcriptional LysR family regulator
LIAPRGRLGARSGVRAAVRALTKLSFVGFHAGQPQHALQRSGLERLGLAGVEQVLGASSTEALLAFVREGLGFSLIPWPNAQGPVDRRVDALRLRGPGTNFPVVASYRRKPTDPLIAAALAALPDPAR